MTWSLCQSGEPAPRRAAGVEPTSRYPKAQVIDTVTFTVDRPGRMATPLSAFAASKDAALP